MIKYLTTELDLINGKLKINPIYLPVISANELVYIRLITGNFKADKIYIIIEGDTQSNRISLIESYKTVYECLLKKEYLNGILKNDVSEFRIKVIAVINGEKYTAETDNIIKVRGDTFGDDSTTDISEIYKRLNELSDALN